MKLNKTVLQNGFKFWYRSDDKFIGQRIALRKYEEYESLLILKKINKDSVVIDIGANIGYYTLLLAKVCKRVYAIEPDKECFEILKKNIEENNLKNVILINKAVSDKVEMVSFAHNNDNHGDGKIDLRSQISDIRKIKTIKLDDVIKEKVDLIKIDVQGHEPQVIAGAEKIIAKYSPILFLEFNGDYKMINFLKKYYKNIFTIDYWFYILRKGIKVDKKTGYVDLVMGINIDFWERYRNLHWKKVIKKLLNK